MSHPAKPSALTLGVPGFTYADLYRPERLRDLHEVFLREVGGADPDLLRRWDEYRADPGAPRPAPDVSLLYVRMAPYLSGFLARLFGIGDEVRGLAAATAEQDVLFRFKADFVRRRVVPLLKGGQPVTLTDAERELAESLVRGQHPSDGEMALARAGCLLLDREIAAGKGGDESEKAAVASAIEALRKWCAAHLHDEPYRSWVVFKLAGNVDYFKLVEVEHRHPDLPTAMEGPESHLRRRDGFTLTDPRKTGREVLSDINYCVLCHEREKDSCSTGLLGKDGKVQENPLGIPLEGCPLDERISEMHMIRKRGDAVGALALVTVDNPMCAGTGHRICNDCMKACIFQKQDPVDIPQIETGILTDVLRLPWGVEIYGLLTRWNPLNVRRPYALPYNGRKVLVVGMGPAGYTLRALPGERGLRRGRRRRPEDRAAPRGPHRHRHRASRAGPRLGGHLQPARRAAARRIRRRVRVRHHGPLGQELPHAAPPDARAAIRTAHVRRHPLRRHALDGRCVGVRVRSRGDRGRRGQADDCRHEEQPAARHPAGQRPPDGAAAHRRLQARRVRQPPGAHALRRHRRRPDRHRHRDRGDGLLSAAGGEDPRPLPGAGRHVRRVRRPEGVRRGGTGAARRVPRARARGARGAGHGPRPLERSPTSCRSCGDGAACRSCTARACSTPPPTG